MTENLSGKSEAEYGYIAENYKVICDNVNEALAKAGRRDTVRIMAVTKTVPADKINYAAGLGVTLLGENRVQEALGKLEFYDKGCDVHFIGGLQTNKVRQIIGKVSAVHSIDNVRLAAELDRRARDINKVIDGLIEINIGGEDGKHGVTAAGTAELARQIAGLAGVRLRGIMVIPPPQSYAGGSIPYFEKTRAVFEDVKSALSAETGAWFDTLSMGMSGDYTEAVACGSTIVRIGTALFGKRQ